MAIPGYNFDVAYWLETRRLAGWLEIATDDLLPQDKQRITNEIESHFEDSVAVHRESGLPLSTAAATALAELGDPEEAAQSFRKGHLTESDVKSMKWLEEAAAKPFFAGKMLVVDAMPLVGLPLCCSDANWLFNFRILGIVLLVVFAGYRLVPRWLYAQKLSRTSMLKGFALSNLVTSAAFWCALTFLFARTVDDIAFRILYSTVFGIRNLIPILRIWTKLRKMGDERNEPPPCQATSC